MPKIMTMMEMWKEKQEERGRAEHGWKYVARGLHNITDVMSIRYSM